MYAIYADSMPEIIEFSPKMMDETWGDGDRRIFQLLKTYYNMVKFHTMDYMPCPFIYALTAMANEETVRMTKRVGFHGCLTSPL